MATSGPNSPGTMADDAGVGAVAWSNTSNATASDNNRATAAVSMGMSSHYLKATDFGFSIPASSTIDGITVEYERGITAGTNVTDLRVRIVKDGVIGSTDKSVVPAWGAEAYQSYGGATDKWGETWTVDDINDSTFGTAMACQSSTSGTGGVDHIRITVHYTPPVGGDPMGRSGFFGT